MSALLSILMCVCDGVGLMSVLMYVLRAAVVVSGRACVKWGLCVHLCVYCALYYV